MTTPLEDITAYLATDRNQTYAGQPLGGVGLSKFDMRKALLRGSAYARLTCPTPTWMGPTYATPT